MPYTKQGHTTNREYSRVAHQRQAQYVAPFLLVYVPVPTTRANDGPQGDTMHDVTRLYPHVRRRNHMHRIRTTRALQAMGVQHFFPADFFVRHWRDQQNYFEQVLMLNYCARCKLPVKELVGSICSQCSDRNNRAWQEMREYRERMIQQSFDDQPTIPEDMLDIFREREVAAGRRERPTNELDISAFLKKMHKDES